MELSQFHIQFCRRNLTTTNTEATRQFCTQKSGKQLIFIHVWFITLNKVEDRQELAEKFCTKSFKNYEIQWFDGHQLMPHQFMHVSAKYKIIYVNEIQNVL